MDEPKPIQPSSALWKFMGFLPNGTHIWMHTLGISALSSVIQVKDEHLPLHWEWLVSVSFSGQRRVKPEELKIFLDDFALRDFEEDNHEPGVARKFWMAVDPQYRKPCPCKDEELVTEIDGYQWSRKVKS